MTGISSRLEQEDRKKQLAQDRLNTMAGRTYVDDLSAGGRYQAIGKPTINGSAPTVRYPDLPSSHRPWAEPNVEPTIDGTCTGDVWDGPALGEPHEQSSAPSCDPLVPEDGEVAPAPSAVAAPPQPFDRRGF
jgi:hypothetical protein